MEAVWIHDSCGCTEPPADAMMVVSDIGEQWSPHTAPAMHADIEMIIIVWFVPEKMFTTIGMSIPKVPHEVPVAKARKAPTRNMIAGNSPRSGPDTPPTNCDEFIGTKAFCHDLLVSMQRSV